MNKPILIVLLVLSQLIYAQTKITVTDGFMEDQPLQGVTVTDEHNQLLGETNAKGVFVAEDGIHLVNLYYDGYEAKKLYLYGKDISVELEPLTIELESTELSGNDTRAEAIIKQAINNRKKNSIENLKTYQYKSYSKFLVTASTDSMPFILFPKNKSDSSYNDVRKLLEQSHLMLGERAMDHKFSKRLGTKNTVKATRISGTKIPMYEFAAMQPISNDFNQEKFKFFFREFVNPVSNSGLREYRYRVSGMEKIEGKEMFIIAFFPVNRNKLKQKIKGYLWVDQETKAIARFYAENLSETNVMELEMDWTNFKEYWFPKNQRLRMDGGEISYPSVKDSVLDDGSTKLDTIRKKEKVWLHLTSTHSDIISPVEFNRKDFKGYANEIDMGSLVDSDSILEEYRDNELTEMERNTYVKIDSLGEKYKIDKNIKLLRIISSGGKYAIGNYDLDLTRIINFNSFEGFRLGLGGGTNYKFNSDFSLNGYGAYGFKDEKFKYGFGLDIFVNKPYSGKIFVDFTNDVEASGRNPIELENNYLKYLSNNFVNIHNDKYFSYQKTSLGYQQDLFQNVTLRLSGIYSEKTTEFGYRYQDKRPDEKFLSFDTELALRWAPKEQIVRTPYGKVTISSGLPVFYLMVSQGLNVFNSDYQPTKFNFVYRDLFRSFLGQTNFQLRAGAVYGDSPIFNLFEGMGNSRFNDHTFKYFELSGLNNFETMRPSEFYSDRYLMLNVSHKFAGFKLLGTEIFPDFIYRVLYGDMRHKADHKEFEFRVPNKIYQETGIEMNQLFMKVLGVGAYYRLGNYAYDDFKRNFLVKLTLRLSFF